MAKNIGYSDLILISKDILVNIQQLIEHGADKIELLMDGPKWNDMEDIFPELKQQLKTFPVSYTIHPPAWDINLTSENRSIRDASFNEYKKAIEFAHMIEADHVVIHPGFCFSPHFDKKIAQQRALNYINELCQIAKKLNIKLAIENVGYHGTSIFTQDEYTHFLVNVDDTAGYLIDTGHAHLNNWDIPQLIKDTKDRLLALHLHDNNKSGDDHLPIGAGNIAWNKVFSAIHTYAPQCQLILEYATTTPLEKLQEGKNILLQNNLGVQNDSN